MRIDCSVALFIYLFIWGVLLGIDSCPDNCPVTLYLCQKDWRQWLHSNKDRASKAEGIPLCLKSRGVIASRNLAFNDVQKSQSIHLWLKQHTKGKENVN